MCKGFSVVVESIFEWLICNSKLCHCSWVGMKLLFPGKLYLATNISHLKDSTSYFCSCTDLWFRYFGRECSCCDCLWLPWTLFLLNILLKMWFLWKLVSSSCKRDWYSRCDIFAVWWIKSYNISLAIFVFIFLVACA